MDQFPKFERAFHPKDPPSGMRNYDLGCLAMDQKISLNHLKMRSKKENEIYLKAHPEIKGLISILLRNLAWTKCLSPPEKNVQIRLCDKEIKVRVRSQNLVTVRPTECFSRRHILQMQPTIEIHEEAGEFFNRPRHQVLADLLDYFLANEESTEAEDGIQKLILSNVCGRSKSQHA